MTKTIGPVENLIGKEIYLHVKLDIPINPPYKVSRVEFVEVNGEIKCMVGLNGNTKYLVQLKHIRLINE